MRLGGRSRARAARWGWRPTHLRNPNLNQELRPGSVFHSVFQPYPGTEAARYCVEKGLIPAPLETDFHMGQSATALYEVRLKKGGGSDVAEVELWGKDHGWFEIERGIAP